MARVVDVATENVRLPVSRERVRHAADAVLRAERVRDAVVSITFVSTRRIAAMNRRHLRHSGATDVISFGLPAATTGAPLGGDIYIAPDVARANAAQHGASSRDELLRLVVHGVLHVLGHDHPNGEERYASPMWKRQEALLRRELARA
ncbi:MAG TPA: rRNA maturation RNase YbeY [Gemmatimonadaceae bacterium]